MHPSLFNDAFYEDINIITCDKQPPQQPQQGYAQQQPQKSALQWIKSIFGKGGNNTKKTKSRNNRRRTLRRTRRS